MSRPTVTWILLTVVYASFTSWYTSCGGPLSDEEVRSYVAIMQERGRSLEGAAKLRAFLESDTGDDFVMVNIMEMREPPTQVPGVLPGQSAEEVLGKYMEHMLPALLSRACHPVMFGTAAAPAVEVWGVEGGETWSTAGLIRYRSRRDLMEIVTNPEFSGPHEFKLAAMTKTIAFPTDPWFQLGDPRLVLALLLLVIGLLLHGLEGHRRAKLRDSAAGP